MSPDKVVIPGHVSNKIDKAIKEGLKYKNQEEIDKEIEVSLKKYPKPIRDKLKKMYEHYKNENI